MRELYAYRSAKPWQAPTSEVYLVSRAGNVLPPEEHTKLVREYIVAADAEKRPKRDNARVIVTGSFCEQPPLGLIKSIEMAGCYVVDDDFILVNRWLLDDVTTDGDPLVALSSAFLHRSGQMASKYDSSREEKGKLLLESVKRNAAEGVIFAAASFCDPALLERPMLQEVLAKHKIPYTAFKFAENTGQMAPIREQAGTFADSIKLWSAASRQAGPRQAPGGERGRDVAPEGAHQPQLSRARHRTPDRPQDLGDVRAGQPERAADVLRLRAQPAGDEPAPERHAQEIRQVHHGRGA
jgi:benzoyl-CoA reductase subunit C